MLRRIMNRRELLSRLAQNTNISEASVSALMEELARVAGEEMVSNGAFVMPGIGYIERRESPERFAKNPKTGEQIRLRAKVNIRFEFASRFKQALLLPLEEREGMLTTSIWRVSRSTLEALESHSLSKEESDNLEGKAFLIDEDFTALLDEHGDFFAYILKTEGFFDEEIAHGLTTGYVSPETLQDRAAELEGVDLDVLEKEGSIEAETSQNFGASFESFKQFIKSAASENLGLLIVTHY